MKGTISQKSGWANSVRRFTSATLAFVLVIQALGPGIFAVQTAYAADTGLKSATSEQSPTDWSNGDRGYSSNNSYTSSNDEGDEQGYDDFNFVIPAGSTINGIEVKIEGKHEDSTGCSLFTKLSWNNGSTYTSVKSAPFTSSSDTTLTFGGAADTWGRTWTVSEFSDTNFALKFFYDDTPPNTDCNNGSDAYVDHVQTKVYYTEPTGTLIVKKVVVGSQDDESLFSFQVNQDAPVAFESDGQNDLTVNAGVYSVVETGTPANYTVDYNNCSQVTVSSGETETCTITNTYNTPTVTIDKTANYLGNEKVTYTINWSVSGGNVTDLVITDVLADWSDLLQYSPTYPMTSTDPMTLTLPTTPHMSVGNPNPDPSTRTITWDFDGEQDGASGTITFTVEVWLDKVCSISNTAVATATYGANGASVVVEDSTGTVAVNGTNCEDPEPEPAQCIADLELINNGDFENPSVTHGALWDTFDSGTTGLDWVVNWMSNSSPFGGDTRPVVASLELHGGVNSWSPDLGEQYAELDGDWEGPDGDTSGEPASTLVYQDIPTVPGENYELKFAFSPRPNTDASNNVLGVLWDGADALPQISASNNTNQTTWTDYTVTVPATGTSTRLQFEDRGTGDSLGTFLDNVSLKCVPGCEKEEVRTVISSDASVIVERDGDDTNAVLLTPPYHEAWTAAFEGGNEGAQWIWEQDGVETPTSEEEYTFVKKFNLVSASDMVWAGLHVAADNSYVAYLNGTEIGLDASEQNFTLETQDKILGIDNNLFVDGENTLTIKVKNWEQDGGTEATNPGGLMFKLVLEYMACKGNDNGGGDEDPDTLKVHILKYLNGELATEEFANGYQFPMHAAWNWTDTVVNSGNGDYFLGPVGHGGAGPYQADTATMTWPADYQTWEITTENDTEGTPSLVLPDRSYCTAENAGSYYLAGYKVGETLSEAENSAFISEDYPAFTNLGSDRYVIVYNETCPTPQEPPCVEGPTWADAVISSSQGDRKDSSDVLAGRSNPGSVLGVNDGTFFSLGQAGSIVVKFDHYIENVEGNDLSFHEVTNGTYPEETASVEVSQDGTNWVLAGSVSNVGGGVKYIDFNSTGFAWIQYVKVTDTTDFGIHSNDADGYDLDAIDATKGLCDDPTPPELVLGDVTMCKVDDATAPVSLAGWQLMLLGAQVQAGLSVDSSVMAGADSVSLDGDTSYVAKATGTWTNTSSNEVDAEYSTVDGWTSQVDGYTGYPNEILELQIAQNPAFGNWGTYNTSHSYWQGFTTSATGTVNFRIFDGDANTNTPDAGWYGDNTGSLLVDIYKGYTGVTEQNGCVTFTNVPFGDYTAEEVLQDGWSKVSGTGSVVVNDPTETFTIVNHFITPNDETPDNPSITTTSTEEGGGESRSGDRVRGFSLGGTSGGGDGSTGAVLGASTELPGLPNTGNGPVARGGSQAQAVMTIIIGFATLAVLNFTAVKVLKLHKISK